MLKRGSQKLCFHWDLNKDFTAAVVEHFVLLTYFNTRGNSASFLNLLIKHTALVLLSSLADGARWPGTES